MANVVQEPNKEPGKVPPVQDLRALEQELNRNM